jgi:hypothetical protein
VVTLAVLILGFPILVIWGLVLVWISRIGFRVDGLI